MLIMKLISIISAVLGILQLLFAVVCAYLVAAIEDSVWNGIRLDDLGTTAGAIGFAFLSVASLVWMLWDECR